MIIYGKYQKTRHILKRINNISDRISKKRILFFQYREGNYVIGV